MDLFDTLGDLNWKFSYLVKKKKKLQELSANEYLQKCYNIIIKTINCLVNKNLWLCINWDEERKHGLIYSAITYSTINSISTFYDSR